MSNNDVTTLPVRSKRQDKGKLFLVDPPLDKCQHFNGPFEVDEDAGTCKCMECKEDVSPIFVLKRLMNKESLWSRSADRYNDEMRRLSERKKTKCDHCGRITQISKR